MTSSCPAEDKANLTTWLADYARQGARWAKEVLLLRPCKFFNLIQGRTVWFIGDGNMQVQCGFSHAVNVFLTETMPYSSSMI